MKTSVFQRASRLAVCVICLLSPHMSKADVGATFVYPADFPDGTIDKIGPQLGPRQTFPFMYRVHKPSCSSVCMVGKVFEWIGPNTYRERDPRDITYPPQKGRYNQLRDADLKGIATWERLYPGRDVTVQVAQAERAIIQELQQQPNVGFSQALMSEFRRDGRWDLKNRFEADACLRYRGTLVESGDIGNHAFGMAMASLQFSLRDTLNRAQTVSRITRLGQPDQPQDQASVLAGWLEYKSGAAWPPGTFLPERFIAMRCQSPSLYRRLTANLDSLPGWSELVSQLDSRYPK